MVFRVVLVSVLLSFTAACTYAIDQLEEGARTIGSGTTMEEACDVPDFSEIGLADALQAEIAVGFDQQVLVRSDDNIVPLIETEVADGRLYVGLAERAGVVSPKSGLEVEIQVPELVSLTASGASHATVTGVAAPSFVVDASGASHVTLSGRTGELQLEASGASKVMALALQATTAAVVCSGASRAEVDASDSVDVNASGASHVCYVEGPVVTQNSSGASTVSTCD